MGIGTSLFLIAVGAILYFAVNADIQGLEISTIGLPNVIRSRAYWAA